MNQPARILVVDDERAKCTMLRYLLEGQGYEVEQAHSGDEALAEIQQSPFHLVLADIGMPGMDGLDLLRRIREVGGDTPVIVMTGYSSLEYAVEAIKHSAADYLANPSDNPDEVLAAVERELADRRVPVNLWRDSAALSAAAA